MRLRSGRRSAGLCSLYGSSPCRHTLSKRQRCSTAQARAVLPYGGGATPSDRSPGAAGGTNHRVRRAWPGSRRAAPAAWPRAAPVLAIWLIRARDERARIASASALAALTAAGNPGRERLITPVSWCGTDSRGGADDRSGQHSHHQDMASSRQQHAMREHRDDDARGRPGHDTRRPWTPHCGHSIITAGGRQSLQHRGCYGVGER